MYCSSSIVSIIPQLTCNLLSATFCRILFTTRPQPELFSPLNRQVNVIFKHTVLVSICISTMLQRSVLFAEKTAFCSVFGGKSHNWTSLVNLFLQCSHFFNIFIAGLFTHPKHDFENHFFFTTGIFFFLIPSCPYQYLVSSALAPIVSALHVVAWKQGESRER